jgi:hypothetical protein
LEDEADEFATDLGEFVLCQVANGGAVQGDIACGGCADDGDELACAYIKGYAAQDIDGAYAVANGLSEAGNADARGNAQGLLLVQNC